jgi:hypothetical protein
MSTFDNYQYYLVMLQSHVVMDCCASKHCKTPLTPIPEKLHNLGSTLWSGPHCYMLKRGIHCALKQNVQLTAFVCKL